MGHEVSSTRRRNEGKLRVKGKPRWQVVDTVGADAGTVLKGRFDTHHAADAWADKRSKAHAKRSAGKIKKGHRGLESAGQ